jgi:hypothetical protein
MAKSMPRRRVIDFAGVKGEGEGRELVQAPSLAPVSNYRDGYGVASQIQVGVSRGARLSPFTLDLFFHGELRRIGKFAARQT